MSGTEVQVRLEGGDLAMCRVLSIGHLGIEVEHEGRRFIAVNRLGAWREEPGLRPLSI